MPVVDELPLDYDATLYRSLHSDLASMNDSRLANHYRLHGRREGRRAHSLSNRNEFAALAMTGRALEIGPFANPLLAGPNVSYADIDSTEELRKLAVQEQLDPNGVPNIDWVVQPNDLGVIKDTFDTALSSHSIEHQPNLVGHLRQVSQLLVAGGRYFLLIPDHRYCFDHFKAPSTIVDVLDAYARNVTLHDPRSLIISRLRMTHNDSIRHWNGDHGEVDVNPWYPELDRIARLRLALDGALYDPAKLRNEHAWFFTPETFDGIFADLVALELTNFRLERLYPTMRNANEFWAVLRKSGG